MGGNSSAPRRVTIEEDDGPGMIKISSSVVKRLKGQTEQQEVHPQVNRTATTSESANKPAAGILTSHEDIRRLENVYNAKMQYLEQKQSEMYRTNTEQFAKTVEEVEKKFLKQTFNPVCQDLQQSVLECYRDNPKQTLLCSTQVRQFLECVDKTRQNVMARKG